MIINTIGDLMKKLTSAVLSAMIVISAPAFAMSHGGAKMDDKKSRLQQERKCRQERVQRPEKEVIFLAVNKNPVSKYYRVFHYSQA